MSNRITVMVSLMLALLGVCFFISEHLGGAPFPDDPIKAVELLRIMSYCGLIAVVLEIIPNALKRINNATIKDVVPLLCFYVGVCIAIFCINPDAINDPGLTYWLITALIVFMIGWRLVKRYLVKRWGQPVKVEDDK